MNNVQLKSFDAVSISLICESYSTCLPCPLVLSFPPAHCYLSSWLVPASASFLSLPYSILTASKMKGRKKKKKKKKKKLSFSQSKTVEKLLDFYAEIWGCLGAYVQAVLIKDAHTSSNADLSLCLWTTEIMTISMQNSWQMQPNTTWWITSAVC